MEGVPNNKTQHHIESKPSKDQFAGTGGVEDVEAYLSSRIAMHLKVTIHDVFSHLDEIFEALDNKKVEHFMSYFHSDSSFRFGSQPVVNGVDNIKEGTEGFLNLVESMSHKIQKKSIMQDRIVIEGEVSYHMKSGVNMTIPFCDIWKIDMSGKIKEYLIYCDPTGLFD